MWYLIPGLICTGWTVDTSFNHWPKYAKGEFEIGNYLGQKLVKLRKSNQSGEHLLDYCVKDFPAGIYFCRLVFDKQIITKKFIRI